MGDNMYYFFEMALSVCLALIGLVMIIFPQKCFKPAMLEKKNGKMMARITGAVLVAGGIVLLLLQIL